jgi:hypothetical protein
MRVARTWAHAASAYLKPDVTGIFICFLGVAMPPCMQRTQQVAVKCQRLAGARVACRRTAVERGRSHTPLQQPIYYGAEYPDQLCGGESDADAARSPMDFEKSYILQDYRQHIAF